MGAVPSGALPTIGTTHAHGLITGEYYDSACPPAFALVEPFVFLCCRSSFRCSHDLISYRRQIQSPRHVRCPSRRLFTSHELAAARWQLARTTTCIPRQDTATASSERRSRFAFILCCVLRSFRLRWTRVLGPAPVDRRRPVVLQTS